MKQPSEPKRYHVNAGSISAATDHELETYAADPDCIEMELCAKELAHRATVRERLKAAKLQRLSEKRQALLDNPFDPRTEISADARHIASRIVTHLWILFVLLPVTLGLLYALLRSR
jgi:hypothetical protein